MTDPSEPVQGPDASDASSSEAPVSDPVDGDSDIDAAYREVLEKMDEVEWELQSALSDASNSLMDAIADPEDDIEGSGEAESTGDEILDDDSLDGNADLIGSESFAAELMKASGADEGGDSFDNVAAELLNESTDSEPAEEVNLPAQGPQIMPRQIIEAALFVGGQPLTSKKLCSLLRREFDQDYVDRRIDELNEHYESQNRPYEIKFGEGGYRMQLKSDFDGVRNRVFGLGPREVKLSQEALEVLSMVAYRQPVTKKELEAAGKDNPGGTLRQLLRRDLISLDRDTDTKEVRYATTARFLDLFGLGDIEELPVAGDLEFR